ncbi:leukocyte elastase inhibitor-like [Haliotis rufescens]|uniref:leukocyte elastase inhibitor-like n=1 Tax=Haliotis rufescens TaxID=6454 RepID=UPI00201F527D|nr:leukocyte elastase inhibitor-like [Haliotis rufescens]
MIWSAKTSLMSISSDHKVSRSGIFHPVEESANWLGLQSKKRRPNMSKLTLVICFCLLLAAVIYATSDASENDNKVEVLARLKRGARGGRRQNAGRRHSGRPRGEGEDEEEDTAGRGGRRRPGRRDRPGRRGHGQAPGRGNRQGRRGHGHRQGQAHARWGQPITSFASLPDRVQRLITSLVGAQNSFITNFHKEVGLPATDVVYSPFSIHQALTMTFMGARHQTAFQMKQALSLRGLGRRTRLAAKKLNQLLNNPGNATLKTANSIYLQPELDILQEFTDALGLFYQANISSFDWGHPAGPEGPINEWVSAQTNNLIPTIINQGTITRLTAMVLVNAIYFKARWQKPFTPEMTSEQLFRKTPNEQVPVQMMEVEADFKVGAVPGHAARLLELPYEDGRFSMLIILPDDEAGLTTIEDALTTDILASTLDTIIAAKLKVFLPRFKLETSLSVTQALQTMGMTRPFSAGLADFTGITSSSDAYISDVLHKAVVEVNEEGSEAAAATAVIIEVRSFAGMQPPSPVFRCDHPFLFFIRDNVSKLNLFVGKFSGGT